MSSAPLKKCPICNSSLFKRGPRHKKCERCGYIWRRKSSSFQTADKI